MFFPGIPTTTEFFKCLVFLNINVFPDFERSARLLTFFRNFNVWPDYLRFSGHSDYHRYPQIPEFLDKFESAWQFVFLCFFDSFYLGIWTFISGRSILVQRQIQEACLDPKQKWPFCPKIPKPFIPQEICIKGHLAWIMALHVSGGRIWSHSVNIHRPPAERLEPTVLLLSIFCVAWQVAVFHVAIDTWDLVINPSPYPLPGVQIPLLTGSSIAVARPESHLVANFWYQVPSEVAKLLLQVVKLF